MRKHSKHPHTENMIVVKIRNLGGEATPVRSHTFTSAEVGNFKEFQERGRERGIFLVFPLPPLLILHDWLGQRPATESVAGRQNSLGWVKLCCFTSQLFLSLALTPSQVGAEISLFPNSCSHKRWETKEIIAGINHRHGTRRNLSPCWESFPLCFISRTQEPLAEPPGNVSQTLGWIFLLPNPLVQSNASEIPNYSSYSEIHGIVSSRSDTFYYIILTNTKRMYVCSTHITHEHNIKPSSYSKSKKKTQNHSWWERQMEFRSWKVHVKKESTVSVYAKLSSIILSHASEHKWVFKCFDLRCKVRGKKYN